MTSFVALEINNQNGVIPARTSQKITATAYPSRRVCYTFKLSYELFSMSGMLFNMVTLHSENIPLSLSTPEAKLNWPLKRSDLCIKISHRDKCIDQHFRKAPPVKWCGSFSKVAVNWDSAVLLDVVFTCQCPFWPYPHMTALSIVLCI